MCSSAAFQSDGKVPDEIGESSEGRSDSAAEVSRPPVRGPWDYSLLCGLNSCVQRDVSLVPEDDDGLPPLLITTGEDEGGGNYFKLGIYEKMACG